jgi:hypothetical protein
MTLVVPQQGTSVALGIATTMQNVLMSTLPLYFGYLNRDRNIKGYNNSLFSLKILASGALISSIVVTIVDFNTGKRLHLPENDKRVLAAKNEATERFRKVKPHN